MKLRLMVLISILMLMLSCDPAEPFMETWYTIRIYNKFDKIFYASGGWERYGLGSYPDTLLPKSTPWIEKVLTTQTTELESIESWEKLFQSLPGQVLSIYFFDADTIATYEWDEIRDGYKVMERRDYTLEDLKEMNWKITYP